MAPECLRRTQLSEVGWQSIPHSWSGDTECSVSELPICPWHDKIATARRSEGGSSMSVCVQDYSKSNQPISLKLDALIEPANRQN